MRMLKAALLCTTPANLASTIRSKYAGSEYLCGSKVTGEEISSSLRCRVRTFIIKSQLYENQNFVLIFLYISNEF